MNIIDPGHIYELRQLGDNNTQRLTFVKRSGGAIDYETQWPGLQTQEVLRALIDRSKYLNTVLPCQETVVAIKHLQMALYWYEVRALRRKMSHTNRSAHSHNDSPTTTFIPDHAPNMPFTEHNIELYEIGEDGHIII